MEHFIARQPIFDTKGKVYAYELLFRSGLHNYFDCDDQDLAAASVIANSNLLFDLDEMTGGTKAFINCTRTVLLEDLMTTLPRQQAVVEVLEDVEPDDAIIKACQRLKKQGYILALDDFVYHKNFEPLLELADIIKVDFLLSDVEEQERLAKTMMASQEMAMAFHCSALSVASGSLRKSRASMLASISRFKSSIPRW